MFGSRCKILKCLLLSLICAFTTGCGNDKAAPSSDDRNQTLVFVSILPQKFFVEQLAGDSVKVSVLVPPGKSPHSFEPTPRQVTELARAEMFFTIGVDFERAFIPTLRKSLPNLAIRDMASGIELRHGVEDDHDHGESEDPHIWLGPRQAKKIAQNTMEFLEELDTVDETELTENYQALIEEIDALDAELTELLAPLHGKTLLVFHPSFGYFADSYGLVQKAIEIGGGEPSPQQLSAIIEEAQKSESRVIFVQPQFGSSSADAVAKAIGGAVVKIDPLAEHWIENMRKIAGEVRARLMDTSS